MNDSAEDYLLSSLSGAAKKTFGDAADGIDIVIEKPRQKSYGDLSTPVALTLAKSLKTNPVAAARALMASFAWDERFVLPDPELKSTIAGGFVNFRLSSRYLHGILSDAARSPQSFGRHLVRQKKKILFEFVSANPTGPMVVVNGRAAAIGDTMARINEWIGNTVEREYYVNDYGNQVELLGKSIACRYFQQQGRDCVMPEGGYEGDYIADLARQIASDRPSLANASFEEAADVFTKEAIDRILCLQKEILSLIRRRVRPVVPRKRAARLTSAAKNPRPAERQRSCRRHGRRRMVQGRAIRRRKGPGACQTGRLAHVLPRRPLLSYAQGLKEL